MRLRNIKVSGFKSFVDPITITFPSNIVGIVGPNGCGKSNVIDAVRWVMGESSAKNLRGDSMSDVIFNGSSVRQPVGKASVELVFDNTEGRVDGPYSQFTEISIKRSLTRDGYSEYFLNKAKCRRRDITDIFLGTGLGPRSYSIIEQGMVGRIIEAKPEELRNFVEEAAGISKYKERRRETENRIRHTRENLSRVEDIQGELESLLRRLKRQASAAKRYKVLKEDQRLLQAQLTTLRWQSLESKKDGLTDVLVQMETREQGQLAELRAVERETEQFRQQQGEARESLDGIQGEFYSVGAEISGVEQGIEHAREKRSQQEMELSRIEETLSSVQEQISEDQRRVSEAEDRVQEMAPDMDGYRQQLDEAFKKQQRDEEDFHHWQRQWDDLNTASAEPAQEREIQRSRIEQLHQHMDRLDHNRARLRSEQEQLIEEQKTSNTGTLRKKVREHELQHNSVEEELEGLDRQIAELREIIRQTTDDYDQHQQKTQQKMSRLQSLQEIQESALENQEESITSWLQNNELDNLPRLASAIGVTPGWEKAADRVLEAFLGGICVQSLDTVAASLDRLEKGRLTVLESTAGSKRGTDPGKLDAHVYCESIDISPLVAGIRVAENLEDARRQQASLKDNELIVSRDGVLLGRNWLSVDHGGSSRNGLLLRAREIETLESEVVIGQETVSELQQTLSEHHQQLAAAEDDRANARRESSRVGQILTELHNQLGRHESNLARLEKRLEQVVDETSEVDLQMNSDAGDLERAELRLAVASEQSGSLELKRTALTEERERIGRELEESRRRRAEVQTKYHQAELEKERLESTIETLCQNLARMDEQVTGFDERSKILREILSQRASPEGEFKIRLEALLNKKIKVEDQLGAARNRLTRYDDELVNQDEKRLGIEQRLELLREELQQQRLGIQELKVRGESLQESVEDQGFSLVELVGDLSETANETDWQQQLDGVERRIDRIGPVNLVAIEEFEEQSERKTYLDAQHADLAEALKTLESVMHKIDKETRTRFRETFDALNEGFQVFFPKLFGGGSAYLELTEDDLLSAGVTVMARPPGKRNSTIHLLSGGEKALTAVSLLFALFDLNPAPFCFLDEVDAPLDDANVERYCQTLRTMSDKTQLLFITHNKITMETAEILCGVTMSEPGVSRLVDVNIRQALEMAAE